MHYFKRLTPNKILGAKSYFTGLDNRLLTQLNKVQKEKHVIEVEQNLKLQLLTNNTIIFGATQLTNKTAFEFFKKNTILLNEGLLVPALRIDKYGFEDLFENKRVKLSLKKEMIDFYNDNIPITSDWEWNDNSKWFKANFLSEINTENSVLRNSIDPIDKISLNSLSQAIEENEILSRELINQQIKQYKLSSKKSILRYRELLYHISGARVMECESYLPQEQYIDYSLTDLEKRKTVLSEVQIFNKIFLATAAESIKLKIAKIDLFDYLDFTDIISIRQIIDNYDYQSKYQEFIKLIIESYSKNDSNSILYNHKEIMELQKTLKFEFKDKIDAELMFFLKKMKSKRRIKVGGKLGKSTVSIALGALSLFESAFTFIGMAAESPSTIININEISKSKNELDRKKSLLSHKQKIMTKILNRKDFNENTILLDMVSLLSNYISYDLKIEN